VGVLQVVDPVKAARAALFVGEQFACRSQPTVVSERAHEPRLVRTDPEARGG
jgi:hypothetical protein